MTIVKSIGKNTLGGGKKMNVSMHEYNRSTHDLSFIWRSPQAPGTLTPALKILCQPGDTFDIEARKVTMTHPTVGPCFGSFKQQLDVFFCPIRLYNALLHNNTLNIGLDMKKVKLPQIKWALRKNDYEQALEGTEGLIDKTVNPSSLTAYLGLRGISNTTDTSTQKNCVPYLAYYDIFKNYYANKQEKLFPTIGSGGAKYEVDGREISAGRNLNGEWATSEAGQQGGVTTWENNWTQPLAIAVNSSIDITKLRVQIGKGNTFNGIWYKLTDIADTGTVWKTDIDLGGSGTVVTNAYLMKDSNLWRGTTLQAWTESELTGTAIQTWPLEYLDEIREELLAAGREQVIFDENIASTKPFYQIISQFAERDETGYLKQSHSQFGLALKTYQSDLFTNYVNTEWIDGDNGINAITAIDTSDGKFDLDSLNIAQKIYNMLNRVAVSDGTYNSWIEVVYTSGGVPHYETPVYIGGWSNEIEFQEVISNSATEEEPLGSLAGRGVSTQHKGGHIHYKVDEPGYIIAINSITPRVDYCQYEEFDMLFQTLDELHKPALDGIGYQDRLWRTINTTTPNRTVIDLNKSIGKQPAWIDYMTSYNKTFGDFSILNKEGWMCLNRYFRNIDEYTTYIHPDEFNYIFAQQSLDATNFWCQIAWNIDARRVMSAKQIPNL